MVDRVKLQNFEDMEAWQESQNLAVVIYTFTQTFPQEEKFGLTNQLRRAGSSISANIAEGFGRQSPKDKLHFYAMAYGSLLEVKSFVYLSKRLGYLSETDTEQVLVQIIICQKLLNALSSSIKAKI